jgi:hypothetical protein
MGKYGSFALLIILKNTAMKNYVLLIATLLCAGMIWTSCQKDNSLVPDDPYTQTIEDQKSERHISPKPGANEVMLDPISNFPDPFVDATTIDFRVWKPTKVSLIVFNDKNERVAVLIGQYMKEGEYSSRFDARNLPAGEYKAVLQVGTTKITETMTKLHSIHDTNPPLD